MLWGGTNDRRAASVCVWQHRFLGSVVNKPVWSAVVTCKNASRIEEKHTTYTDYMLKGIHRSILHQPWYYAWLNQLILTQCLNISKLTQFRQSVIHRFETKPYFYNFIRGSLKMLLLAPFKQLTSDFSDLNEFDKKFSLCVQLVLSWTPFSMSQKLHEVGGTNVPMTDQMCSIKLRVESNYALKHTPVYWYLLTDDFWLLQRHPHTQMHWKTDTHTHMRTHTKADTLATSGTCESGITGPCCSNVSVWTY